MAVNLFEPNRRRRSRREEDRRLLQRDQELRAAQQTCQALFQHHRVDELVEQVLRTAMEVVQAQAGSILLADPETNRLVFRYVVGEKAELLQGTSFPWSQGIAGAVFQSGEPAVIADVKRDPRHLGEVDLLTGYETRDMITLPLKKWEGAPIGVLNVLNKREGVLDHEDLTRLTIIATVAAVAIQQARLFEEAKLAEVVRLLGDIGHDLKNLLQPLVMGAELLRDELLQAVTALPRDQARQSEELCHEAFRLVEDTGRRIQDRVKQIADCVKGLTTPPKFAPVRVASVVEAVFATLQLVAKEKGVALCMEQLEELPALLGDDGRLFNAFYNLINNALVEVNAGGTITVRRESEPDRRFVAIAVVDTGKGMPPDVVESLFSARAISRKPGGTGLGTKIVKDVVDAHRGTVDVRSEEGKGTTFTLRLPVDPSRLECPYP